MENCTIRRLVPADADAFIAFFKQTDFSHDRGNSSCFCLYPFLRPEDWELTTARSRETIAHDWIAAGKYSGFVQLKGREIIGWCNANDLRELGRYSKLREELGAGTKAALIACFVVRQDYRGQGVSKSLLEAAIDYYKKERFDLLLALPNVQAKNPLSLYRGKSETYARYGFQKMKSASHRNLMGLLLNS